MMKFLTLFTILVLVPATFSYEKLFPFSGYQHLDSSSDIPLWKSIENQHIIGEEQLNLHRFVGSRPTILDPPHYDETRLKQKATPDYNEVPSRQLNQIFEKDENVRSLSSPSLGKPQVYQINRQEATPDVNLPNIDTLPRRQLNNIIRGDSSPFGDGTPQRQTDETLNKISNFENIVDIPDPNIKNKPVDGLNDKFQTGSPTYGSPDVNQRMESPVHIHYVNQLPESPSYVEESIETPNSEYSDSDNPIKTPTYPNQPTETYVSHQPDLSDKVSSYESRHVDQPVKTLTYDSNKADEQIHTQTHESYVADEPIETPTHQVDHPIESPTYEFHHFENPVEVKANVEQHAEIPTERISHGLLQSDEPIETPFYGSNQVERQIEKHKFGSNHVEGPVGISTHEVVQPMETPTLKPHHVDKPLKTLSYRSYHSDEPRETLINESPNSYQSPEVPPSHEKATRHVEEINEAPNNELNVDNPTEKQIYGPQYAKPTGEIPQVKQPIETLTYGSLHNEEPIETPTYVDQALETPTYGSHHVDLPTVQLTYGAHHIDGPTETSLQKSNNINHPIETPTYISMDEPPKTLTYGSNHNAEPLATPIYGSNQVGVDEPIETLMYDGQPSEIPSYDPNHIDQSSQAQIYTSHHAENPVEISTDVPQPIEAKSYGSFDTEKPTEIQDYRLKEEKQPITISPVTSSSYHSPAFDEHFEITPSLSSFEEQQTKEPNYSPSVNNEDPENYIDRPLSVVNDDAPTRYDMSGIHDSSISSYNDLGEEANESPASLKSYDTNTIANDRVATSYDSYIPSRQETNDKVKGYSGCVLTAIDDNEYSYYDTASNKIMNCAPGSKFSKSLCTCIHAPNFYDLHSTRQISPQTLSKSEEKAGCYLLAVDNVPTSYYNKEFRNFMECAPGTVFSQDVCSCIHNNDIIIPVEKDDCRESYGLTFDDSYLKNSNNQLPVGGGWSVKLGDGMAEFNQDSTINFWSYMGRPYGDSFTIQMKFKDLPSVLPKQNLVTNCGTSNDESVPSILVELNKNVVTRGIDCHVRIAVITEISQSEITLPVKSGAFNTLQVIYDKGHLKAKISYASGETFSEETQCSGEVLTSTSDLRLGACDMKHDGFVGLMDWFKFYPCSVV